MASERLFAGYETRPAFYDEMFEATGVPRVHCRDLCAALDAMPGHAIAAMQEHAERSFLHEGITFAVYGEEGAQERIIPIDFLPRLLDAADWDLIERGLRQRLDALNRFLGDVYGAGAHILSRRRRADRARARLPTVPRPRCRDSHVPHGVYVARLRHRYRAGPTTASPCSRTTCAYRPGVSYMLANRRALKSSLRNLFRRHHVRRHRSLRPAAAPDARGTRAGRSHRSLRRPADAGRLQFGLSTSTCSSRRKWVWSSCRAAICVVHNGFVYMRTTAGLRRVDVIYRRIDDDFIDPLAFRADSLLGTPGLFHAYRLGNVTIANAPGTGVADDKSVYAYVPDMIRYYLAEEPLLANVRDASVLRRPTAWPTRSTTSSRLVVKMVGESGGYGMLDRAARHARANAKPTPKQIREDPGQLHLPARARPLGLALSSPDAGAAPRHVDLRPFVAQRDARRASCPERSAGLRWSRVPSSSTRARAAAARTSGCCRARSHAVRETPKAFTGLAGISNGRGTVAACSPSRFPRIEDQPGRADRPATGGASTGR